MKEPSSPPRVGRPGAGYRLRMTRTRTIAVGTCTLLLATATLISRDAGAITLPTAPPLAISSNVTLIGNVPTGPALGMVFKDHWAFVTGPTGLTVLDIAIPAAPVIAATFPLPHFENEDVDLCGNVLLISMDRAEEDVGAVLYAFDVSDPRLPLLSSVTPIGLTLSGRGAGHIANFVTTDCSLVWIDGGERVEVFDLSDPAAPASIGTFESVASQSSAFRVSHDTELDTQGFLWSVGGGGVAGYALSADPLAPTLVASSGADGVNPSPYNDFILHNSQRRGDVLLVTEEDYIDTSEDPPGGCRGQGKFETWSISMTEGAVRPLDTWMTELNGSDSKAFASVNCSSHWFDEHQGLAAVGWYEQGVRFLDVHRPTAIRQVGYYLPANGSTWAAYWSPTDPAQRIVYTADAYRGVDVLSIARKANQAGMPTLTAPIPDVWLEATTPTYAATEVWGFACPITGVTPG